MRFLWKRSLLILSTCAGFAFFPKAHAQETITLCDDPTLDIETAVLEILAARLNAPISIESCDEEVAAPLIRIERVSETTLRLTVIRHEGASIISFEPQEANQRSVARSVALALETLWLEPHASREDEPTNLDEIGNAAHETAPLNDGNASGQREPTDREVPREEGSDLRADRYEVVSGDIGLTFGIAFVPSPFFTNIRPGIAAGLCFIDRVICLHVDGAYGLLTQHPGDGVSYRWSTVSALADLGLFHAPRRWSFRIGVGFATRFGSIEVGSDSEQADSVDVGFVGRLEMAVFVLPTLEAAADLRLTTYLDRAVFVQDSVVFYEEAQNEPALGAALRYIF